MPIPPITNNPASGTWQGEADNKGMFYKLLKATTNQLHAKGLLVVVINKGIMKELNGMNTTNFNARMTQVNAMPNLNQTTLNKRNNTRKRLFKAQQIRTILNKSQPRPSNFYPNPVPQRHVCHSSVDPSYIKHVFEDITGKNNNVYIAFHYSNSPLPRVRTAAAALPAAVPAAVPAAAALAAAVPAAVGNLRRSARNRGGATRSRSAAASSGPPPPPRRKNFAYRVAAVTAWQTLDKFIAQTTTDFGGITDDPGETAAATVRITSILINNNPNAQLLNSYDEKRIAVIDIVCACDRANTNPHNIYVEGAATDLFLFTLAKIAKMRGNGGRKYDAVITYLAKPIGAAVFPLQRMVTTFGFVPCRVEVASLRQPATRRLNNQASAPYFILCDQNQIPWQDTLAQNIIVPDPLPPCPIDTNAHISQCIGGK